MGVEKFPAQLEPESVEAKSERKKEKREIGIVRIVGAESPEEEQKIILGLKRFFENQRELAESEIPKTPDQQEIVKFLAEEIPKFAAQYGAEPLNLTEDKVILHNRSFLSKIKALFGIGEKVREAAYYDYDTDLVDVNIGYENPLLFAHLLAHEFLHFHSFHSVTKSVAKRIEEGHEQFNLEERRMGLGIQGRQDVEYFRNLNEAIIEELTRRFDEKVLRQCPLPSLRKEIEKTEKGKKVLRSHGKIERANEIVGLFSHSLLFFKVDVLAGNTYVEQRKKLNSLIKEIYKKNNDDFESEEDIFNVFARAVMSGRLLSLARLIEKTFGKGSFRQLGEETGGEVSQKTYD